MGIDPDVKNFLDMKYIQGEITEEEYNRKLSFLKESNDETEKGSPRDKLGSNLSNQMLKETVSRMKQNENLSDFFSNARKCLELIIDEILSKKGMERPEKMFERINQLKNCIEDRIINKMHNVRSVGNTAAHSLMEFENVTKEKKEKGISDFYDIISWYENVKDFSDLNTLSNQNVISQQPKSKLQQSKSNFNKQSQSFKSNKKEMSEIEVVIINSIFWLFACILVKVFLMLFPSLNKSALGIAIFFFMIIMIPSFGYAKNYSFFVQVAKGYSCLSIVCSEPQKLDTDLSERYNQSRKGYNLEKKKIHTRI